MKLPYFIPVLFLPVLLQHASTSTAFLPEPTATASQNGTRSSRTNNTRWRFLSKKVRKPSTDIVENSGTDVDKIATSKRRIFWGPIQTTRRQYDWRDFVSKNSGVIKIARWVITGMAPSTRQSDEEMRDNLSSLARMLILLREYNKRMGIPDFGCSEVRRRVISDITKELYLSGAPTWVLETVMERVAEGLTGRVGVEFFLLPYRCFIIYPPSTPTTSSSSSSPPTTTIDPARTGVDMFKITPGFCISRLGAVEQVAVRLASFASNTKSSERMNPTSLRIPTQAELDRVEEHESANMARYLQERQLGADELAHEILNLASSTYGLFFFLNSNRLQGAIQGTADDDDDGGGDNPFWVVDDSARETFTRLAANEASKSLEKIRIEKRLYSQLALNLFRILSSAGACAMWFGGSVPDMLVSGFLAVVVAYMDNFTKLAFEERMLTEVVTSFVVGLCAGFLAIQWPNQFCFGAIAVGAVMELMQGFKVVYAFIEVMSKHSVAGVARLLEGILFTGLISYSLKFGLDSAFRLLQGAGGPLNSDYASMLASVHGINQKYFALLLPFAAVAWSGLFRPSYADLPWMAFHGMLAFCLNWAGAPMFVAGMCVTFSAGIVSRFTGREALGNTLAGLYALVPGAYMVRALLSPSRISFLESVLFNAGTIGLGGWTGTLLCSPTILGKTSGWTLNQRRRKKKNALLFF